MVRQNPARRDRARSVQFSCRLGAQNQEVHSRLRQVGKAPRWTYTDLSRRIGSVRPKTGSIATHLPRTQKSHHQVLPVPFRFFFVSGNILDGRTDKHAHDSCCKAAHTGPLTSLWTHGIKGRRMLPSPAYDEMTGTPHLRFRKGNAEVSRKSAISASSKYGCVRAS